MLSAIAARKAALAAKQQTELPVETAIAPTTTRTEAQIPLAASELELSTPNSEFIGKRPRKRKARVHEGPKIRHKRTKKLQNADIGRTRYFEAEQPIEGFDDDDIIQSEMPKYPLPSPRAYSPSQPIQDSNDEDGMISGFVTEDAGPSRGYSPSRPVVDSSEDEGEGLAKEIPPSSPTLDENETPGKPPTSPRRTFVPNSDSNIFRLTRDDVKALHISPDTSDLTAAVILLPAEHSLTFVGTACITLLQGTVAILGTPLYPSLQSHRVFSPRSNPVASLEALKIGDEPPASLLYPKDPKGRTLPQRIQNAIRDSDTVIFIQPLLTRIEGLGKVCRTFDGVFDVGSDIRKEDADDAIGVEGFHPVNPRPRPHTLLQPFFLPESWSKALDAAVPPLSSSEEANHMSRRSSFVALVKGSKKCGKSTFARTLLNRLTTRYRRVAFLECDLGQSEFTPGGMVSLHVIPRPVFGPPFTHPTLPHRAHYIGHTTPRSSPSHYLSCIQALMLTYRMDVQYAYQETMTEDDVFDGENLQGDNRMDNFIPLVVNTQGWIKGLGGDLLRKIEEMVEATDVFDLDAQASMFPRQRNQSSGARLHILRPILASPLAAYYTPADYRSLSMMSYFHCLFPNRGKEVKAWSTDLPLCALPPWEVDCKEAIDRIVLVGAGFEDVVTQELDGAINCGVLALVCEEDPLTDSSAIPESEDVSSWPYTQGASAPSPTTSHCVGLALVRGIDATTHKLHFLTPVSPTLFSKCRVLVKGELELPVWGMLDFRAGYTEGVAGVKWEKVPYLQMGGGEPSAIGGARRRVRKNLMRRGQM